MWDKKLTFDLCFWGLAGLKNVNWGEGGFVG